MKLRLYIITDNVMQPFCERISDFSGFRHIHDILYKCIRTAVVLNSDPARAMAHVCITIYNIACPII